jgi:hypothetical protein
LDRRHLHRFASTPDHDEDTDDVLCSFCARSVLVLCSFDASQHDEGTAEELAALPGSQPLGTLDLPELPADPRAEIALILR